MSRDRATFPGGGYGLHLVLACIVVATLGGSASALAQAGPPSSAAQLVRIRATADVEAISPGSTFHLAFVFDLEPHWHIYWRNPGASGMATEIDIVAPRGFEVGTPLFPRPVVFRDEMGATYGYERRVVLFVPVKAPAEITEDAVRFDANIVYLVCRKMCLMGMEDRSVELPIARGTPAHRTDGTLETFRARLPKPIKKLKGVTARFDGETLAIDGPAPTNKPVAFYPVPVPGVGFGTALNESADGTIRIRVPVTIEPDNALGRPMRVTGLVVFGSKPDDPSYHFDLPVAGPAEQRDG